MIKGLIVVASIVILSGCIPGFGGNDGSGGFMRSDDGGRSFEEKVAIDEEKTIGRVSTLSMAVNPLDSDHLYIGTVGHGIYVTYDGAETWKQINFTATSVRGLAISTADTDVLYASGMSAARGKLYRSDDAGETWRDVYSEPATDTLITSLWLDPIEPQVLYLGTNEGVIVKTTDGGQTWRNIFRAEGSIISILTDSADHNTIYVLADKKNVYRSRDAGNSFEELSDNEEYEPIEDENGETEYEDVTDRKLYSLAVDPSNGGVLFIGTDDGILRSEDHGSSWKALSVIGSVTGLPIYAMAIHPRDSNQLTFGAGQVIYTSIEGQANKWSTVDSAPGQSVSVITYNQFEPQIIYTGLRTSE